MRHFLKESRIRAPRARVFAFHERPDAFKLLTPPWAPVQIIQPAPSLKPGSRAIMRLKFGFFSAKCVAEHVDYEPGVLFSDRQIVGPFGHWFHRHRFLDDGEGGTIYRDELDYLPPLGPIGALLGGPILESKLKRLFDFRHEVVRRACEEGPARDAGEA